jgi:hypothetical protein
MAVIDDILLEWSYRCSDGIVDMNNPIKVAILNEVLAEYNLMPFEEGKKISATKQAIETILNSEYKSQFVSKSTPGRIGSKTIKTDEFETIISKIFNISKDKIKIFPPLEGPNDSRQFNLFQFPTDQGTANIILSGGAKSETSERQERGLIKAINSVPGIKNIISENGVIIEHVIEARKIENKNQLGSEPYADIALIISGKEEPVLISAKGSVAFSLAGGGLKGISSLSKFNVEIKQFIQDLYTKTYSFYKEIIDNNNLQGKSLYRNSLVPDVSMEIPGNIIRDIMIGSPEMGGPVAYYYIGDMDVSFDVDKDTIYLLNGELESVETFIKDETFYANIIKRDGDIYFTDSMQNINGIELPRIFTKKEGSNSSQARFIISHKIRGKELK